MIIFLTPHSKGGRVIMPILAVEKNTSWYAQQSHFCGQIFVTSTDIPVHFLQCNDLRKLWDFDEVIFRKEWKCCTKALMQQQQIQNNDKELTHYYYNNIIRPREELNSFSGQVIDLLQYHYRMPSTTVHTILKKRNEISIKLKKKKHYRIWN